MSLIHIFLLLLSVLLGFVLVMPEISLLQTIGIVKKKQMKQEVSLTGWVLFAFAVAINTILLFVVALQIFG